MNGRKLSKDQLNKFRQLLATQYRKLGDIRRRMEAVQWYDTDPVYNSIVAAEHAVRAALCALPEIRPPDVQRMLDNLKRD